MLVDSSLWTAFHEAKSALLEALCAIPTQQSHTFAASPESRESTRTSISELVSAISEAERELKVVQDEFVIAQNLLSQKRVTAKRSLSPIEALPPELICRIVSTSCEASNPIHTLRVSHVSRAWRDVVISTQSLFTCADWNRWRSSLVQLWCARAGTLPLTMQLGVGEKYGIISYNCPRYELFKNWFPRLERLDIDAEKERLVATRTSVSDAINHYLKNPTPLLTHLRIRLETRFPVSSAVFRVQPDQIPVLRVLDLGAGIRFKFKEPHRRLRVISFSLSMPTDWDRWARALRDLPNLKELAITLDSTFPVVITHQGASRKIRLPYLRTLKITDGPIGHELPLLSIVDQLAAPGLNAVTLCDANTTVCRSMCNILVSVISTRISCAI